MDFERVNYPLYYYIPWPASQELSDIDPNNEYHIDYYDDEGLAGSFVEKTWFDKYREEYGL